MTLPASGSISMYQVRDELWYATYGAQVRTWAISFDQCRGLAGVAAAPARIAMSDLRGKSSYTPMTASGVSSVRGAVSSQNSAGTAYAYPSVNVSGGSGGYTFSWSITSSTNIPTLSNATGQTATVSKAYARSASGEFDAYLQCVITDSTGHTVTVSGVEAYAAWGTAI